MRQQKESSYQSSKLPIGICINDMHIGKENISEFKLNWMEALDYCDKLKVKLLIIGGDTFLSRVSQSLSVLMTVKDCISEAKLRGIDIINAPGNHDKVSLEDTRSYCHVFDGIPGYKAVDEYELIEFEDVAIHIMPYFPENGSFKKRLKGVVTLPNKKNMLYCHQGINGALAHVDESNNKELPTHLFKRFDSTLVGHYHNRVNIEGTEIHYVGSSRQHNFGEDIEKGYTVIYSDGSFEYLPNNVNVKYITFEEDFDDIDKSFLKEISQAKNEGYRVRVIIHCKSTQKKLINKSDYSNAGAAKVEIRDTGGMGVEAKQSSGAMRFNKDGIKNSYREFCEEKGNDDPDFGLKYIDLINI